MKPAIEIENLSKLYQLGTIGATSIRDSVERWWNQARNKSELNKTLDRTLVLPADLEKRMGPTPNSYWALKDINLKIPSGEILGIIGRNGAGKSTLLKILSRITEPTEGRAIIRGRVASLLEVGTGFHPELTGRENIFLNGTMLGMTRHEVQERFDEIVDFSGIEQFIDTPVKRYSSGMYVRLGFSVAAHLLSEILLVDEVLAVGDAEFQKKCLEKIKSISNVGKTVLFVSHNLSSIEKLCTQALLIEGGHIVHQGQPDQVSSHYMQGEIGLIGERSWDDPQTAPGDSVVRMRAIRVLDQENNVCTHFDVRDPVTIEFDYDVLQEGHRLIMQVYFKNELNHVLFISKDNLSSPWRDTTCPTGRFKSRCTVPGDFFNESKISIIYGIDTYGAQQLPHATDQDVVSFSVSDAMSSEGVRGNFQLNWRKDGVRPRIPWHVEKIG